MNKSAVRWLLVAAAALPAFLPLMLILRFGVNMPFWDEWSRDWGGLFIRSHQGQLSVSDFLAQHNEHRIVIPRLAYFLIGSLTHWNTIAVMFLSWVIVCATSAVILLLCLRTQRDDTNRNTGRAMFLWFCCNTIIFSPAQHENWLWGVGLQNFTPSFFVVTSILVATSRLRSWPKLILAALLAMGATFSSGNGIICWVIVAPLLWSNTGENSIIRRRFVLAWTGAFLLCAGLYFVGYHQQDHHIADPQPVTPLRVVHYFVAFLGNAFSMATPFNPLTTATVSGAILLTLYLAACGYVVYRVRANADRLSNHRFLIWLAVGAWSILSAAMAAPFRVSFGVEQALALRYVTFSLYLPIAITNLVQIVCDDIRQRHLQTSKIWSQIPAVAAGILLLLGLFSLPRALNGCALTRLSRLEAKAALLLINILPDNPQIETLHPEKDLPGQEVRSLNEFGFFRPSLVQSNNAALIEQQDARQIAGADGEMEAFGEIAPGQVEARGWAIFSSEKTPADAVFLTIENERGEPIIFQMAEMGDARPDIAQERSHAGYNLCGWGCHFPATALPHSATASAVISAWAFNTNMARAFKLKGTVTIPRRSD